MLVHIRNILTGGAIACSIVGGIVGEILAQRYLIWNHVYTAHSSNDVTHMWLTSVLDVPLLILTIAGFWIIGNEIRED